MNKRNGLKMIAVGLVLSHKDRINKIQLLNDQIDSIADSIHSSSDTDGMPHGNKTTDPVSSRAIRIQKIEVERDAEQERVNAVEWGFQYATDLFKEEYCDTVKEALLLSFHKHQDEAFRLIDAKTDLSHSAFLHARDVMIKQIQIYLHLLNN